MDPDLKRHDLENGRLPPGHGFIIGVIWCLLFWSGLAIGLSFCRGLF